MQKIGWRSQILVEIWLAVVISQLSSKKLLPQKNTCHSAKTWYLSSIFSKHLLFTYIIEFKDEKVMGVTFFLGSLLQGGIRGSCSKDNDKKILARTLEIGRDYLEFRDLNYQEKEGIRSLQQMIFSIRLKYWDLTQPLTHPPLTVWHMPCFPTALEWRQGG